MRANSLLLASLAVLGGCVGNLGGGTSSDDESPSSSSSSAPSGGGGAGTLDPAEFVPAAVTMHRLTVAQYQNTIRDLLGDDIAVPTDLEADTKLHGFSTVAASEVTISPHAVEQFETAAYDVVGQIFEDEGRRVAFVGCEPAATADPCIAAFLDSFGKRAWRRPLATDELGALANLATTLGDSLGSPWKGIEFAVAAMLQSPHFLFRVEQGVTDPNDSSRLMFSQWEMASRLSYLLWNSTPDEELLEAAELGDLATSEGLRRQARRLVDSPRARESLLHFFTEFLNLERLDDLTKNVDVFPQMTPTLGASMRGELERMFDDVVFEQDEDFRTIMNTRRTFVNAELASFYGLPEPAAGEFELATLPDDDPRGGLMGTAGILALYSHNTSSSPTLRGKFIRVDLLCQDVPPPPEGVKTSLDDDGSSTPKTTREKLEQHRKDPACSPCHEKMDPLGLGLENFDAIGAYRTKENGITIDAASDVDGVPFEGAKELGNVLRDLPRVGECIARRFYRYGTGHLEEATEEAAVQELAKRFEAVDFRLKDLVLELIVSDGFRRAMPAE